MGAQAGHNMNANSGGYNYFNLIYLDNVQKKEVSQSLLSV